MVTLLCVFLNLLSLTWIQLYNHHRYIHSYIHNDKTSFFCFILRKVCCSEYESEWLKVLLLPRLHDMFLFLFPDRDAYTFLHTHSQTRYQCRYYLFSVADCRQKSLVTKKTRFNATTTTITTTATIIVIMNSAAADKKYTTDIHMYLYTMYSLYTH